MAGEQTVVLNTSGNTTVRVVVNAIGSSGSHVALVVDTTTTRLNGYSIVPTVNNIGTGIAEIVFTNVTGLTEFQTLICKVNGTADSTAFSEYAIPVKVLPDVAKIVDDVWDETININHIQTNSAGWTIYNTKQKTDQLTFSGGNVRSEVDSLTNSAKPLIQTEVNDALVALGLDHLVDTAVTGTDVANNSIIAKLVSKSSTADWDSFNNTTDSLEAISDDAFDAANDTVANVTTVGSVSGSVGSVTNPVTTDTASRDASKADITSLATSAALTTVDTVVDAIKVVTDKLDGMLVIDGSVYQFTTNALENAGGTDPASIYTYFTSSNRQDTFKATGFNTTTPPSASAIADAVWDEPRTGHTTSGTFGFYLDAAVSGISASVSQQDINDIVDAVWDEGISLSEHNTNGTAGSLLSAAGGAGTKLSEMTEHIPNTSPAQYRFKTTGVGTIADVVWDELQSEHTTAGSFGKYLDDEISDISTIINSLTESIPNTNPSEYRFVEDALANTTGAIGMASANLDTQLSSISSGIPSEADVYTYFTDSDGQGGQREDVFKADVSGLGNLNNAATDIAAVKAKTDLLTFTGNNLHTDVQDIDSGAATTIASSAYVYFTDSDGQGGQREDVFKAASSDIYTYFTNGTNEDAFKADVSSLSTISTNVSAIKTQTDKFDFTTVGQVDFVKATVDTLPQSVLDAIYNKFTDSNNEDVFKADITTLEANVASILGDTSQLTFTNGLVDANAAVAITNTDAATIYNYFIDGTREDVFKADVSALASQASVDTIDSNVDAIKVKTDKLTFNASNEVASEVLSGATPTDIYNHFISGTREDAFKNSAAEIRQAIGMTAPDLDSQLDAIVEDTGTTIPATLAGIVTDIGNVPTNAEFEARTILSADYFDPSVDSVIVGTNNDKTGYSISGTKTTLDDLSDFDPSTDTVDLGKVFGDAGSAQSLKDSAKQMTRCTVTNQSTPSTAGGRSSFSSANVNVAAADHFVGRLILFTSGTLEGQASDIVDYELSNGVGLFSVTELTSDPSVNDTFIIV